MLAKSMQKQISKRLNLKWCDDVLFIFIFLLKAIEILLITQKQVHSNRNAKYEYNISRDQTQK